LEGLWLRADRQGSGRGRQGRSWLSPPGNLYASTLVHLQPEDPPAPTLTLLAAVALHEAVSLYAEDVRIKWPNDLVACSPAKAGAQAGARPGLRPPPEHLEWAKLAGILLERQLDAVIVGFGVNLVHHPDLPGRAATSLKALAGAAPEPAVFAEALAEIFARWLALSRQEGPDPILHAWRAAAHPRGTPLATSEGNGLFDGLDETGALRLRLADGAIRVIHAGDVFVI